MFCQFSQSLLRDQQGDRRAGRAAAADARKNLGAIGLDRHAAAAAVAALAPPQFERDGVEIDRQTGRHALEDGDETLAVRLTGRQKPQHSSSILYEETATLRTRARARFTRRSADCARGLAFALTSGMLMLDRYLVAGGRALDLATGASIRWRVRRAARGAVPPLVHRARPVMADRLRRARHVAHRGVGAPTQGARRGIDDDRCSAFRAALADARDGRPRALDLASSRRRETWALTQRVLAREARLAGFVPLAADAFGAVLSQARWRWPSWLKDRSIVVFATDTRLSPDATLALFRLATKDARPHLIVRGVTSRAVAAAAGLGVDAGARERAVRARSSPPDVAGRRAPMR